jgi:GTPase SAR1 family protein
MLFPTADQSKKLFQEAMQSGYVVLRTIVLLLIGVAGAGKTCFCHMLFNEPPPSLRVSTPLAKSSIRANSSVRGKGLSFKRAAASHREGAVFWERISAEMFNSLIAERIKSGTNPGTIAEYLPVLLSVSEDLQLRVVPSIEHTISTHETYREMERAETATVSHPQLSDIDQLFEMESVKQLLHMISQSNGSVELLRREWVYIIDSGGQPQFHELLPTFVRHVSAVAFFVKLNETLATRPMIEYYSEGGPMIEHYSKDGRLCKPYQSSQTNLQIIQNCLQAMQARCMVDNTVKCPELFFVGTHYDFESQEEPLSAKNAQLFANLHQHDVFRKHLVYNSLGSVDQLLYPVNALTPSAADKQVVASFRQDVMEKCQKHERQIPIRWFVLESLLQELSQHGIISFKKCLEVAGRLGMDEDRLRAAIEYLAQLNIFEFYPSVLPKVVFTTSQVILTKVTELVEYSHLLRNRSVQGCCSDDREFRDNGYLSVKLLEHERFSSHFVSGLFEVKDLLALLEDRLVITRRVSVSRKCPNVPSDDEEFMMMAVLSELPPEKLEEHRLAISKSSTHLPIAVHYPGSLFPAGIFTSLVSHLQTSSNWTVLMNDWTGKPECLFKNCVDFIIDTDELSAFTTLIYTHQWIELHVKIDGDQQQACSLKRMLFGGLKHAAEVQKYSDITPELAFLCPHEQEASSQAAAEESQPSSSLPPHLATVTRNKQRIRCKLDKRISYEVKGKCAIWIASSESTESIATAGYENRKFIRSTCS